MVHYVDLLERVRGGKIRRVFKVRYRRMGRLPNPLKDHLLKQLGNVLEEPLDELDRMLDRLDRIVEENRGLLTSPRRELRERYGAGYITVEKVRVREKINCSKERCMWMCLDQGSPFRHIYFVFYDKTMKIFHYTVKGYEIHTEKKTSVYLGIDTM
ncbi:MAG: hypothetical protein QXJ56_07885 [Ignisphaera sp.]